MRGQVFRLSTFDFRLLTINNGSYERKSLSTFDFRLFLMKSVMIVFNQANTGRVEYMLDVLGIKGFTFFEQVQGRGTNGGEPRRGTHAWPEMNSCVITVVEDEQLPSLLESVKKLDLRNEEVGVRAFVWDIVATV